MADSTTPWRPNEIIRFIDAKDTSTGVAIVVTDQGQGYLKALGNAEGPHALASEWVGTSFAAWLGLPTFDFAIITVDEVIEIPLGRGCRATAGPAFITRREAGHVWSGGGRGLRLVANPEAIAGLVVLDTWIRNRDRHYPGSGVRNPRPDNVFLSTCGAPSKQFIVKAMDHTHCFSDRGELTRDLASIGVVKDGRVYGLFSAFKPFVNYAHVVQWIDRLRDVSSEEVEEVVEAIPEEWQVEADARHALIEMVIQRAGFVAETLEGNLRSLIGKLWLP